MLILKIYNSCANTVLHKNLYQWNKIPITCYKNSYINVTIQTHFHCIHGKCYIYTFLALFLRHRYILYGDPSVH